MCKRLKCVHVNKHALLLVGRTCVANLLKTCNDHYCTRIRTRTSKRLPSKLTKELNVKITHMEKMMKTKLLFCSIKGKGCTFMNTLKSTGLKKKKERDLNLFKQDVEDSVWCLISSSTLSIIPLSGRHTSFSFSALSAHNRKS